MTVLFISIGRMSFLAPIFDNADQLFALVITPSFYLHHIEVVDQDPANAVHKQIIKFYHREIIKIYSVFNSFSQ